MKALKLFILFIPLVFFGCDHSETLPKYYTVSFAGEGVDIEPQSVVHGGYVAAPENPERENYGFSGWVTDKGTFADEWDFKTDMVTCDTTLYAKWELDPFGTIQILDGCSITAIAFDSKANAWIGTREQGLICYNANETIAYNFENSVLPGGFFAWDIAVDKNDNVWIGTSSGLWKYDGKEFTLYNSRNTIIPEDFVSSIVVDSKNNIWMASCRFRQGGLVKYDGTEWTVYTPGNSSLPGSLIYGIAIDKSDNVWLALGEYGDNQARFVKISNDEWTVYTESDLGFRPFTIAHHGIQFDSKNRLWVTLDYMLSSNLVPLSPHFFIFDSNSNNTTLLSWGNNLRIMRSGILIDSNDNGWCFGIIPSVCGVWINEQLTQFDMSEFGGARISVIKEDPKQRIWFGTEDGIYIRKNT